MSNPTGDMEASAASLASNKCLASSNMSTPHNSTEQTEDDFVNKSFQSPRYPHEATLNRRAKDCSGEIN